MAKARHFHRHVFFSSACHSSVVTRCRVLLFKAMELEMLSELSQAEDGQLLNEEALDISASSRKKMRWALVTVPLMGAFVCFFLRVPRSPTSLSSATVHRDVVGLHQSSTNDCGGYDVIALNDFQHGWDKMVDAGWVFSNRGGHWSAKTKYRPDVKNIAHASPPQHAYWGWDYPGNGVIRLRLHGQGEMTLDVGNAYTVGKVEVSFDQIGVIATIPAATMSQVVKHNFSEGYMLTISEDKPRAIIVINSISFACPKKTDPIVEVWAPPGTLRGQSATQYFSGASWELVDVDCADYMVIGTDTAVPWGETTAVLDRKWCGDSCLQVHDDCDGFLYPDPGQGGQQCKQIRKTSAGEGKDHVNERSKDREANGNERRLTMSGNICGLNLTKWAVHVLKEVTPPTFMK